MSHHPLQDVQQSRLRFEDGRCVGVPGGPYFRFHRGAGVPCGILCDQRGEQFQWQVSRYRVNGL